MVQGVVVVVVIGMSWVCLGADSDSWTLNDAVTRRGDPPPD